MPKYVYSCSECQIVFEASHSMTERLEHCDSCNNKNCLKKVPTSIAVQYRDNKVGKVVNDYIKEAKEEIQNSKDELLKQEFEK